MSSKNTSVRLKRLFKQNIQNRSQQVVAITLGGGLEMIPDDVWGYSFRYLQVTGKTNQAEEVLGAHCAVVDIKEFSPQGEETLKRLLVGLQKNPDALVIIPSLSQFSDEIKTVLLAFAPRLIAADEFKSHDASKPTKIFGEGGKHARSTFSKVHPQQLL